MSRTIAIVGAGPSGFYALDGLTRALPDARIDLIDRLPTPYGLARFGVAPDHQGTKAVTRQFDRLLAKPGVRFLGGVEIGRDVSLAELRGLYDAVLIASGCPRDRKLGIPGEDLRGVHGSAAFTAWFNGHPDLADLAPPLADARSIAVIGNGNVAIDVARVLAKTADEMAKSDIAPHASALIAGADIVAIGMHGRRGPAEASFTNNELAELGRLHDRAPVVAAADLEGVAPSDADPTPERLRKQKNIDILRGFASGAPSDRKRALSFGFHHTPVALHGVEGRVRELELADTRDPSRRRRIAADLVVTCIGYDFDGPPGLPLDRGRLANDEGRVRGLSGVYVVGWAKRGPSGTIPTNRADSLAVAERLVADLATAGSSEPGPAALDALLAARGVVVTDTAGWRRIEMAENAGGLAEGRPRVKLATWDALRATASPA